MRRFLLKILLVGIPVSIVMLGLEVFVRWIPNEYSYKYQYMENNIRNIETLILGSSVGRTGINPSVLGETAFNVANVSQDLIEDCAILQEYVPKASNLSDVIIALLPNSYSYLMCDGVESWRLRKYKIYMKLEIKEEIKFSDYLEISNTRSVLAHIKNYLLTNNTIDCYSNGFGKDSIILNERDKLKHAVNIANIHNDTFNDNPNIILEELEQVMTKCQDYGVNVYLVLLPCYYMYYERLDIRFEKQCDDLSRYLAEKFDNVCYLNFYRDPDFLSFDFRNANHLGPKGAEKFTQKLKDYIHKNNEQ